MKFVSLKPSSRDNKRYEIIFSEPKKTIHFGAKNSNTFLDHKNEKLKSNYIKRHQANEDWTRVNAGSLSRYLLWEEKSIYNNLKDYLDKFGIAY